MYHVCAPSEGGNEAVMRRRLVECCKACLLVIRLLEVRTFWNLFSYQ